MANAHSHDHADHGHHGHDHAHDAPAAHDHAHGSAGGHSHSHDTGTRGYAVAMLVNLAYTALEAGYGFHTNSLALLSDALHNLGDVLGLGLAWAAAALARRQPTAHHTYGWRKATLLAPLANAIVLMVFSGGLAWEAIRRFSEPPSIPALPVIVVAAIGIAVNLGAGWLLHGGGGHGHSHGGHDLNRRGAILHLMADAAVSLAAVIAGVGMWWLGWEWLDPATALLVGVVIAAGTYGLLRESFSAAMDAVPQHIDQAAVGDFLATQPGVSAIHHLHIWPLGAGEVALTAHLVRPVAEHDDAFIDATAKALAERFGISHATLQLERGQACTQPCHGAHAAGHAPHP
ncbi:cobalt-zinc-cadmium efflux system protein [Pseudoxanthomonas sp. GM95]|uniref:cation diffusion facilitator family transporter n=1 Tax=Pseudoxanthomonas sp. GM95 TaxID=1881043 RepID=UPI0008CD54D2|nr:cation diffusion facilitator family transporter [Pseudoxanthomonas sp. GM95]SEL83469.1 cobalt-zinc-cadmium efflux system protein [Pseudoxanthomonas sp. GM95]